MRRAIRNLRIGPENGQAIVLLALGLVVLLGFVSMSIDVGSILVEKRKLQSAVDAAALAGAQELLDGSGDMAGQQMAVSYMAQNGYAGPETSIQVNIPPATGPYAGQSNYIEVTASTPATTWLLQLFMQGPVTVSARAVAEGRQGVDTVISPGCTPTPPAAAPLSDPTPSIATFADDHGDDDHGDDDHGDGDHGDGDHGDGDHGDDDHGDDDHGDDDHGDDDHGDDDHGDDDHGDDDHGDDGCSSQSSSAPAPVEVPNVVAGTCQVTGPNLVVDGRRAPVEGSVKLGDLIGGVTDYGDVYYGCDGTYLYFTMILNAVATTGVANENVYGPKGQGAGPYHSTYNTGWVKKHDFDALLKSDRARFQIACDGSPVHDFVQDYLYEDTLSGGWASGPTSDGEVVVQGPDQSASSLEWNLEHPAETGWGDDPGEDPLVQSPPFDPQYPTYSSEYDGWIWEMIYEFRVPLSAYSACTGPVLFGLSGFSGQAGPLTGIHSSPAKASDATNLVIAEPAVLRLVE